MAYALTCAGLCRGCSVFSSKRALPLAYKILSCSQDRVLDLAFFWLALGTLTFWVFVETTTKGA